MTYHAKVTRSASRSLFIRTTPCNGGLKAWHLRDFVQALDAAGVPDDAKLTAHRDEGTMHFSAISVHHTEDIEGWPDEAEPGPAAPSTPEGTPKNA